MVGLHFQLEVGDIFMNDRLHRECNNNCCAILMNTLGLNYELYSNLVPVLAIVLEVCTKKVVHLNLEKNMKNSDRPTC